MDRNTPDLHAAPACLAWAGWRMKIPADWRPLDISGSRAAGAMVIGTASKVMLHLTWQQAPAATLDPERWLQRQLKKTAPEQRGQPSAAVLSADFREHAWLTMAGGAKAVWIGRAVTTPLIMKCVLNLAINPGLDRHFLRTILPSLALGREPQGTPWSIFNISFYTPPGFEVIGKRLFPGDMAVWFRSSTDERLLVRQLYPIDLALGRMSLAQWLAQQPYKEYYKFFPDNDPLDWQLATPGARWQGLKRSGFKRLPVPLDRWRPRYHQAAIVRDPEMDRLLLCAHESADPLDGQLLENTLQTMNWAQRELRRQAA